MKKRPLLSLPSAGLLTSGLLLSVPVSAAPPPVFNLNSYLYASAISGYFTYPTDDANNVDTITGLRVGARVSPILDIEGGYIDLGEAEDPDNSDGTLGITTQYVAAKPTLPLGLVEFYGRAGIHNYRTSEQETSEATEHDYSTDFLYGFGVDLATAPNFSLGFSYTVYHFDGSEIEGYEMNLTFHP